MEKKNSPMTMKDIARELGISVATVSRALKDSPRISEERRKAIQTPLHGGAGSHSRIRIRHRKLP